MLGIVMRFVNEQCICCLAAMRYRRASSGLCCGETMGCDHDGGSLLLSEDTTYSSTLQILSVTPQRSDSVSPSNDPSKAEGAHHSQRSRWSSLPSRWRPNTAAAVRRRRGPARLCSQSTDVHTTNYAFAWPNLRRALHINVAGQKQRQVQSVSSLARAPTADSHVLPLVMPSTRAVK